MVSFRKNWVVKIVMVLCIILQCATLFPHHHHSGTSVICFNVGHCTESHNDFRDHQGCTNSCPCGADRMQSHSHEPGHGGDCAIKDIVIIKPQSLGAAIPMPVVFLPVESNIPSATPLIAHHEQLTSRILLRNIEDNIPAVEPIHIIYIAKAHSLRAPSVLS